MPVCRERSTRLWARTLGFGERRRRKDRARTIIHGYTVHGEAGAGWSWGMRMWPKGAYVETLGVVKLEKFELGDIALEHAVQVPLNAIDLGHDGGLGKSGADAGDDLIWRGLPRLA